MKTKKGPNLKAMKNRETIEQQKFENLTGSSFGLNPEEFPGLSSSKKRLEISFKRCIFLLKETSTFTVTLQYKNLQIRIT